MFKQLSKDQKTMLIVLSLINFFNYVDRQVIFPLFHLIKEEFGVNDFQLGLLGTVFMLIHSLASLPLGMLADKYSRKVIIAGGVFFWTVASFASGLAGNFKTLLGIRSVVGIGEASYAPAATAMIADEIPKNFWSQAQSIFNSGLFVGGTFGAMIGGVIAYYYDTWRLPFFVVSIPGVVLGILTLRLREKRVVHEHKKSSVVALFKNAPFVWILIGGILSTFASGAFISWGVEFIVRYKGYNLRDTSLILGSTLMAAGVIGVFGGGILADWLQKKFVWGRSAVVALSHLGAFPFMMLGLAGRGQGPVFVFYFFVGTVFLSFYYGPITAVMHEVVPAGLRATAFALYILVIHLLGDTMAPAAVGAISDKTDLRTGMVFAAFFVLLAGAAFYVVVELIRRRNTPVAEGAEIHV